MAMKKKAAAPKKAAPKKGDEPVRAGKRQQRANEMDFAKTYKKKQSTGGDQPVRAGKRRQTASEMDFWTAWDKADRKKNPNVGNQSPRVKNVIKPGEREYMKSEEIVAKRKNPNAKDMPVRAGTRQQRYGRGR
jgi:hypothetical protein